MAYKFQFGSTKLSGSTIFEEELVTSGSFKGLSTISGSGRLSGKELILDNVGIIGTADDTNLLTLSADTVEVAGDLSASLDLKGRKLTVMQNGTVGVTGDTDLMTLSPNSVAVAGALSASGQVDLPGAVRFGTENQLTVSAVGVVSSSAASDFEGVLRFGAGQQTTVSAAGIISSSAENTIFKATINRIVVDDADINGGAIDDATIGAATQSSGKFTTLSASSTADFAGQARFGVENQTTISTVGVLSSSAAATFVGLHKWGAGGYTQIKASTGAISSSAASDFEGLVQFGAGQQTTVSAAGIISSSAENTLYKATINRIVVDDADINGGAIDGTVIGGTTEAAVSATTLSASSTLNVVGASNFGPGNLASISAAGIISGSGNSTLHRLDSNQLVFASGSLNGPMYINKNATTVDEILGLTSGSLLYHDEATGLQKLGSFSSYATAIAGTGITATDGVLSVDTTGGDSMTATHIPAAAGGNATLISGINYMTTTVTGSSLLILPSGSGGDVVIVKAPAGVTSTNFIKITSSVANGDEIDGFSEARIESPHGAVSMIYSNSDGKWVIY